VAAVLSAKTSEALLEQLRMSISHDTALNLVRAEAVPHYETPRVLGVDDFAIRKRESYGTVLVDIEKHKVIELLPDRSSATLIAWLNEHPGVETITRDRSRDYKTACDKGAPQATQVADRWHLLKNLSDILKRWFERHKKHLLEAAELDSETATKAATPTAAPTTSASSSHTALLSAAQGSFEKAVQQKLTTRRKRQHQFEEAKRLREEGFSMPYIANKLGMGRSTLNRWFAQGGFPDKQRGRILEPYKAYLKGRFAAGISNKMQLYREIVSQGFTGSHGTIYLFFAELEAGIDSSKPTRKQEKVKRYTAYEGTRIFTSAKENLNARDKKRLEQLFTVLDEAKPCYDLVQRYLALFKLQNEEADTTLKAFSCWLEDATNSGINELVRFAKGLSHDKAAIEAALTLPWSNGQTEGKITKLKLIKRQMYGRANFDLLRQKVLLAA
jgi:transposase